MTVIKRLYQRQRFGFIARLTELMFFHQSACVQTSFDQLRENQAVTFDVGRARRREARTSGWRDVNDPDARLRLANRTNLKLNDIVVTVEEQTPSSDRDFNAGR
jgi:cold shock CspA family protein